MIEEQQNDKAETINAPLQDDNDYYGGDSSIKVEKEVKEPKETKEETKAKESELNDETDKKEVKKPAPNNEEDVILLKDSLKKTQQWGQEKNKKLLANTRKINQLVNSLKEESIMSEEDVTSFLTSLESDESDDIEDSKTSDSGSNNRNSLKEKLDNEFKVFQRYNKANDNIKNYQAFYQYFSLLTNKQQDDALLYMEDESPDEALNYVINQGTELRDIFGDIEEEDGGIIKHIKKLKKKLEKLEKNNTELASEIDSTTKKVYTKSDSKTKEDNGNSYFENDYYA
jgi:hypothetical protein